MIFQLSLFGLAMGIATVYVIPSKTEPAFWLVIFLYGAYAIATSGGGNDFLHGLVLGLANSIWITAAHILLMVGPAIGLISGIILGLFAFIAGKLIKTPPAPESKANA